MAKKQPRFKTEAQEAEWWSKNQNLIANRFEQAKAAGKFGKGTVARVARERASQAGPSPTITIRLAENDHPDEIAERPSSGDGSLHFCCAPHISGNLNGETNSA